MSGTWAEKAARVIDAARIADIRLVAAECHLDAEAAENTPPGQTVELGMSYGAGLGRKLTNRFTALAVIQALVTTAEGPSKAELVRIQATFEVSYQLTEGLSLSDEELTAFAEVNALFNAWPYFREFVQSSTGRMGVPPVLLPLFKIPRADVGKTTQAAVAPSTTDKPVGAPRAKQQRKQKQRARKGSEHRGETR